MMSDKYRNHRKNRDIFGITQHCLGHFVAALLCLCFAACTQTPRPAATLILPPAASSTPAPVIATYQETPANGLSCVPYARQRTGMALYGDAYAWWDSAAGHYQRGNQPALGAVLVLPQTSRLHSGHVAVVAQLVGSRQILVDHANWIPDEIATNMPVIDVSPGNDWTQLRFWNAPSRTFGAIYPASGFVYAQSGNTPSLNPPSLPAPDPGPDQTVIISGSGVSVSSP
jgi:surface antigen